MANDLSNKEMIVTNYLKENLKANFPNLDVSDHGAFMEMFGTPHIKLLLPLLEFADRVKLTQSLDNWDQMTDEEMDVLAARYFFYRKGGQYAIGYATISFDDVPANKTIQIPAGTQVESKQGYRYRAVETLLLNEEELADYYNPDSFTYQIPVLFEAENQGAKYNIEENELNKLITQLPHFFSVTNETKFSGGKDQESNFQLANRIRETGGVSSLGVERGWIRFVKEFDEVEDVIVAGYGHPLMKRDIIGMLPEGLVASKVSPDVHWGGKVDLHIRGARLVESLEIGELVSENGDLLLALSKHPTHDILDIQFSSPRYTDPELDPTFFYVKDFYLVKDEGRETMGTLQEKSWVVINDERLQAGDTVVVRYRYNQLFEEIYDSLYKEENRPPASDVLLKEARKKTLHCAMVLKLESVVNMQEKDRNVIRQKLYNWVEELPLGEEFQASDLTVPLYKEDEASAGVTVDYIHLPSQFVVTDHDNKYLYHSLNNEKRAFLDSLKEVSVYFQTWLPYFETNVTIQDFFDFMHLMTYENIAKSVWNNVSFKDNAWGKRVHFINVGKRMLSTARATQKLSLPKWQPQANEYFELGFFAIYDDLPYAEVDLEKLILLIETIGNPNEEEKKIDNILHLTVYCAVLLYVISSDQTGGLAIRELFDWLSDLTKGTPIDYQVHH